MVNLKIRNKGQLVEAMQFAAEGHSYASSMCTVFDRYCPSTELQLGNLSVPMGEKEFYLCLALLKYDGRLGEFPHPISSYEDYRRDVAKQRKAELGQFTIFKPRELHDNDLMIFSSVGVLSSNNPCFPFNTPSSFWMPSGLRLKGSRIKTRPIIVFRDDINIHQFWAGICGLESLMLALGQNNNDGAEYEATKMLIGIISAKLGWSIMDYIESTLKAPYSWDAEQKIDDITELMKTKFNQVFGHADSQEERNARYRLVQKAIKIANKSQKDFIEEQQRRHRC